MQMQYPHRYLHSMSQFPTGHSPAQSPLSPGSYAGDDYFTSRQASPGPASSPSASSKIKSRPRPSTAGSRVSHGGIKALFGASASKGNRTSLDLKSESSLQGLTAAIMTVNQSTGQVSPKTPPLRKKKAVKAVSAEITLPSHVDMTAGLDSVAERSQPGSTLNVPSDPAAPTLTLAERRAAAAAAGMQRRRSASESSTSAKKPIPVPSTPTSLIPPNLGLDAKTKRLIVSPNGTPSAEGAPFASPSILSASGSSPAPIQIGRITPRHSSSQTRTEEQQRQLDAAMERVDFDDVTVAELKEMLRQRGKHGGGKKADLIKRLQSEIEVIRAKRQSAPCSSGVVIPPPLASPTHNLYKTLGGMHIGSPPVAMGVTPSSLRYALYNGAQAEPSPDGGEGIM
ncbi:hypothetical protein BGZ70_004791 [Mortierella alpina]|uniref:SAP domain-containing protein n=1 Tax=Mortierella alpina TaxID=64518 RepID=A0A9P6LUU4_MORAP|nr:hypothetical protein BGZ70_004791 [Mortierella alpina]